jgi:hypothetical protein
MPEPRGPLTGISYDIERRVRIHAPDEVGEPAVFRQAIRLDDGDELAAAMLECRVLQCGGAERGVEADGDARSKRRKVGGYGGRCIEVGKRLDDDDLDRFARIVVGNARAAFRSSSQVFAPGA